ncbi:hypothetical protein Tco_1294543 [Tanacetum coccineum]
MLVIPPMFEASRLVSFPSILYWGWAYAFHRDKASSVRSYQGGGFLVWNDVPVGITSIFHGCSLCLQSRASRGYGMIHNDEDGDNDAYDDDGDDDVKRWHHNILLIVLVMELGFSMIVEIGNSKVSKSNLISLS